MNGEIVRQICMHYMNWLILDTSRVITNSEERFLHVTPCPLQGFSHLKCWLQVHTYQFLETRVGNGSGTVVQHLKIETDRYLLKGSRNYK